MGDRLFSLAGKVSYTVKVWQSVRNVALQQGCPCDRSWISRLCSGQGGVWFVNLCFLWMMRFCWLSGRDESLNWKRVEHSLQVREEFKYLGIRLTRHRSGASSAQIRVLCWSVVVKRDFYSNPHLWSQVWVVTGNMGSQIKAAEISFLQWLAGFSRRDRVWVERSQLRCFRHLIRMSTLFGGFILGISNREEALRKTQNTPEGLYVPSGRETP